MDLYRLPRYFINRAGTATHSEIDALSEPIHIVDCFMIEPRNRPTTEYIITVNNLGQLQALPGSERNNLPVELQTELSFHEMSNRGKLRRLLIDEFYLFNIQLLEQPTNTPGLDDPIYLYGNLIGPFPNLENTDGLIFEGQLTLNRVDLLDGVVQGANFPFCYSNSSGSPFSRCFHMMLAGDSESELRSGKGIVLAYPLMPPELLFDNIANDFNTAQLLYDLLNALREDLISESIKNPLRDLILPVPNRMRLEQQLKAEGYTIKGDTAIKQSGEKSSWGKWLGAIVDAIAGEELQLPPEGRIGDYLQIAHNTLASLPNFPPARLMALHAAVKVGGFTTPINNLSAPPVIRTPNPSLQNQSAPEPQNAQKFRVRVGPVAKSDGPASWMQDFLVAHQQSGLNSRLTLMSDIGQSVKAKVNDADNISKGNKPVKQRTEQMPAQPQDWMSDFSAPVPAANSAVNSVPSASPQKPNNKAAKSQNREEAKEEAASKKPSWMEDFE